jgi:hypothetical protein
MAEFSHLLLEYACQIECLEFGLVCMYTISESNGDIHRTPRRTAIRCSVWLADRPLGSGIS